MARRKQPPAPYWSPMKTPAVPAPKPRPKQRQNGGRKPDPAGRGIPVMCRLPPDLKGMVDAACDSMLIDRSAFIRAAIIHWFRANPPQKTS